MKLYMNTDPLLEHLKRRALQKPSARDIPWHQLQSAEREHYENQMRDLVQWRKLTTDEQIQQRLSSSDLAHRVNRINVPDLEEYTRASNTK